MDPCMDLSLCYPSVSYLDLLHLSSLQFCRYVAECGGLARAVDKVRVGKYLACAAYLRVTVGLSAWLRIKCAIKPEIISNNKLFWGFGGGMKISRGSLTLEI